MRLHEMRSLWFALAAMSLGGCGSGGGGDGDDDDTGGQDDAATGGADTGIDTEGADESGGNEDPSGGEESESETDEPDDYEPLDTPQKGGPIVVNDEGTLLAVANKATDDVSIFALPELTLRARVDVGDEPVSVSFHPDNETLFVVNRADGNVMKVVGAKSDTPSVDGTVAIGSEPVMGALAPMGKTMYVSSWVDGQLAVVDTDAMSVITRLDLGGAPYAVCVTNDRDEDEADETIFVTDFYGRAIEGALEATDGAREGRVFRVTASDLSVATSTIAPFADSGVTGFEATGFYPNQLYGCAISDPDKEGEEQGELMVTAVGASPAPFMGNTDFHQNVQGMVAVIDIASGEENRERSANLNALVDDLAAPKRFVAVPREIAFVDGTEFGYVVSTASNSVLRVAFDVTPTIAGAPSGVTFLPTGASPTGIAIFDKTAYVVNEVDRSVTSIDLAKQESAEEAVASAELPTSAGDLDALRGQKFFNTGLGRWSTNGWVSCLACHPAGLSDNVTWSFPAGPRQSIDLSTTFDRGGSVQRILNWTGIFDEIHDFELNTRGVAGGTGAIVSSTDLNPDGTANTAVRIDFVGPGGTADPINGFDIGSARAVAVSGATPDDWDAIETYIATLRPPKAATVYAGDPDAGRVIFEEGGCQNCHGGPLWTLAERYFTPQLDTDARTLTLASQGVASIDVRADQVASTDPSEVFVLQNDANGAPQRHSCVMRKVGTFDADGPQGHGAEELRQSGTAAQGVDGFNVPSLLGMALGAPYLHNGAAETLEELLDPAGEFTSHLRAGNQVFSLSDDELADLIAFLRSIDDDTETFAIDSEFVFCPDGVDF
ncbi:MAG TPA: YncE family protein [Nannocystaceae bacterium]|nr:YncE family protein [Nannocystaceae bacterium]